MTDLDAEESDGAAAINGGVAKAAAAAFCWISTRGFCFVVNSGKLRCVFDSSTSFGVPQFRNESILFILIE